MASAPAETELTPNIEVALSPAISDTLLDSQRTPPQSLQSNGNHDQRDDDGNDYDSDNYLEEGQVASVSDALFSSATKGSSTSDSSGVLDVADLGPTGTQMQASPSPRLSQYHDGSLEPDSESPAWGDIAIKMDFGNSLAMKRAADSSPEAPGPNKCHKVLSDDAAKTMTGGKGDMPSDSGETMCAPAASSPCLKWISNMPREAMNGGLDTPGDSGETMCAPDGADPNKWLTDAVVILTNGGAIQVDSQDP